MRSILVSCFIFILLILVGCQSADYLGAEHLSSISTPQPTSTPESLTTPHVQSQLEIGTVRPSVTSMSESQQDEFRVTEVTLSGFDALQCEEAFCQQAYPGFIQRPIANPGRITIDWTYPYGSTLGGTLEVHHGVEFQNSFGTPVLAVAAGEVVFAGKDDQMVLGPYVGFYGDVVILRHVELFKGQDLFTLYAHLSVIEVAVGEQVDVGTKIGEVGMSGAADGSHLHFEVRLGDNDYSLATNPVLWFAPIASPESDGMSTLAGRIVDPYGVPLSEAALALEKIGADGSIEARYYPLTYTQRGVTAHPQLGENFAVSDIPPGDYRLALVYGRLYELYFTLDAGHVGFIELQLE
jgi:murein DD-endopeptidase MepM/ murein hydrolase activator NlpD